jgi:hypothetical protein
MESAMNWRYFGVVDSIDEATAFLIARNLIAEHGDDVARFLQDKIDALTDAREYEQLAQWFIIRNAVAISLRSVPSVQ